MWVYVHESSPSVLSKYHKFIVLSERQNGGVVRAKKDLHSHFFDSTKNRLGNLGQTTYFVKWVIRLGYALITKIYKDV